MTASEAEAVAGGIRESGNIAWSVGSRSSACRMNIHTTSTISLIDSPPAPSMLVEGEVCDIAVSVSVPLYTGIWIR